MPVLIGVAVLVVSATALWAALKRRPRRFADAGLAGLGIVAAVALFASPNHSEVVLGRLVGLGLVGLGVRDLVLFVRGAGAGTGAASRRWLLARSLAVVASGLVLLAFPAEVLAGATTIVALGWMALSVVVIAASLDTATTGTTDYAESTRLVGQWLADRPKSVDDRQSLYDKILFEGPTTSRRVVRFLTLMTFASIIASMGVITDSTAVVIGAMLIAPLMTPLMGMAISLVMGWPHRLARSASVALVGIVLAIGIGVIIGLVAPAVIDTNTNSQILARSSPTILDLITALAAGCAGAYGLSRPDVSDSLPGVAIAISLVPPLSVVGIAYSQGDWIAGNGALLLFATNMLAILIMGGLTFVATGVTPVQRAAANQHRVRTSLASIGVLGAAVVGALLLNGAQIASDAFEQSSTEDAVIEWLEDHPSHSLIGVDVDGETVTATILGPTAGAPSAQTLADALTNELERPVTANVRLVVEERDTATAGG